MDYQVVLSPSARADLSDIVGYISFDLYETQSPIVAESPACAVILIK